MSYPYPQDRHRDRKEKGDQPYADAKEQFAQAQSQQAAQAEEWGETHLRDGEPDAATMEQNLRDAARDVQRALDEKQERGA